MTEHETARRSLQAATGPVFTTPLRKAIAVYQESPTSLVDQATILGANSLPDRPRSMTVQQWADSLSIKPHLKATLQAIVRHAWGESDTAWPTNKTLSKITGKSVRRVQADKVELIKIGALATIPRDTPGLPERSGETYWFPAHYAVQLTVRLLASSPEWGMTRATGGGDACDRGGVTRTSPELREVKEQKTGRARSYAAPRRPEPRGVPAWRGPLPVGLGGPRTVLGDVGRAARDAARAVAERGRIMAQSPSPGGITYA